MSENGNNSAMREALVAVKKSIDGIGASSLDCDPKILMASLTLICGRLSARIERALSAPPRNCDKYKTFFEAKHAWENVCKAGLPEQGPFENWLFAPATEQKVETDESK